MNELGSSHDHTSSRQEIVVCLVAIAVVVAASGCLYACSPGSLFGLPLPSSFMPLVALARRLLWVFGAALFALNMCCAEYHVAYADYTPVLAACLFWFVFAFGETRVICTGRKHADSERRPAMRQLRRAVDRVLRSLCNVAVLSIVAALLGFPADHRFCNPGSTCWRL
jgi:hypothetical protein